ncbi:MAG: L,D-transpeptidase family protein [Terrimicrobiaceae bacterium]|nr:L,D-transpeptidase family protein [Terrimicrobiaceae bacterium]
MNRSALLGLSAVLLILGGCASYDRRLTSTATSYLGTDGSIVSRSSESTLADKNSYWDGDGVGGAPSIVVSLSEQTASFYKGGKLVGVSAISTGREGFGTPVGKYKVIGKNKDHVSNLYGDYVDAAGNVVVRGVGVKIDPQPPGTTFRGAPMPYFMRLTNSGVGLHQGFLPGVPDSRGCIRLPEKMAKIFWDNTPPGTPVQIVN